MLDINPHDALWVKRRLSDVSSQYPGWSLMPDGSIRVAEATEDSLGTYTCVPYNALGTMGMSPPATLVLKVDQLLMPARLSDWTLSQRRCSHSTGPALLQRKTWRGVPSGGWERAGHPLCCFWRPWYTNHHLEKGHCQGQHLVPLFCAFATSLGFCFSQVGKPSKSKHNILPSGSLQFLSLSKEDHGEWECVATNVVTSITASTRILVIGKLHGATFPNSLSCSVRSSLCGLQD